MMVLLQRQLIEYSASIAFYVNSGKLFDNLSSFIMEMV